MVKNPALEVENDHFDDGISDRVITPYKSSPSPRWHGIDYLRAFMSLAVIAWHIRLFGISALFDINGYSVHKIQFSDIINFNLLLLAVPVLFLISIFLQVEKWMKQPINCWSRIERLAYMYCFWTGVFLIVCKIEFPHTSIWPDSAVKAIWFIISGSNSLFYFLFSLLVLTILSHLSMRLRVSQQIILAFFSLLLLWVCPAIVVRYDAFYILTAFWNPLNFIVYVYVAPLAYYFVGKNPDIVHSFFFKKTLVLIFILFVVTASCEWAWFRGMNNFEYDGYAFPSYTRLSVAVGATFLFLLSFTIRRPPGFIIRLLSEYSLGLYCVHVFVMFYYFRTQSFLNPATCRLIDFFLILMVSLGLSILLRRAFSKGLI